MIKIMKEFNNTGGASSSSNNSNNKANALDLAKKYKFSSDDASEESGLLISPNGLVGVQYDINSNKISIRPDNDLNLGSQELSKFKQDLSSAEKLASEISKIK